MTKLTDAEVRKIVEENQTKSRQSVKDFLVGAAKAVTTDVPGFLMDVADKLAGDTVVFGEKDNSARLFEKMTGIKSTNSISEIGAGILNPIGAAAGAAKAVIIPAKVLKAQSEITAAERALASGIDPKKVWKDHGVYRSPGNGELLTVIPDSAAELINTAIKSNDNGVALKDLFYSGKLGDVLEHPEFAKQFPDLMESTRVQSSPTSRGSFTPTHTKMRAGNQQEVVPNTVRLGSFRDADEMLSTTLHETQHLLQREFGMPRGGSPDEFFANPDLFNTVRVTSKKFQKDLSAEFNKLFADVPQLAGAKVPVAAMKRLQEDIDFPHSPMFAALDEYSKQAALVRADRAAAKVNTLPIPVLKAYNKVREVEQRGEVLDTAAITAYNNYKNIAGEAEARLVQTQHVLDDYKTYPPDLYDVPLDKLILSPVDLPYLDASDDVQEAISNIVYMLSQRQLSAPKKP